MVEEIKKEYEEYKSGKINLGELYIKLLKVSQKYSNDKFEAHLKIEIPNNVLFLLLTYQNSHSLR